ncbi:MAG: hypothetical protein ACI33M_02260, partial [Lysinibacillus sp.]
HQLFALPPMPLEPAKRVQAQMQLCFPCVNNWFNLSINLEKIFLEYRVGFTFAVARHSHRSRNRRSKQATPVLAPVEAVAKREGYKLDLYLTVEIIVFKLTYYKILNYFLPS